MPLDLLGPPACKYLQILGNIKWPIAHSHSRARRHFRRSVLVFPLQEDSLLARD